MSREDREKQERERDQILKTLTERSFAGIYLVQDGRFCFLNEKAASYAGYDCDELMGIKADKVVHPEDWARIRTDARAMLRGERSSPYVFRIITKQGDIRWIMETVTPISFQGRPALLGSSMDITDRMEAEENLRKSEVLYRTIFETTGTATIIVEEDTTVTLVNTEFEKLSGGSKDYWEGKRSWTEFVCDRDKARMLGYHRLRRVDPRRAPRNYEFGLVDRQGNVRDIIITISMIPGTTKSVASFVDITERKKAEEILRKRERELEEKTHELEEVNAALRVLLKRREEDKVELEERLVSNVEKLVMPYVEKMKRGPLGKKEATCLEIVESNLRDVVSPFAHRISSRELNLTPAEFQVAGLVREGKTTKEIADFLHVSPATIEIHRNHIRKKLGLNKKKANLRVHLLALR